MTPKRRTGLPRAADSYNDDSGQDDSLKKVISIIPPTNQQKSKHLF
jgi:hypothetical protein